MTVSLPRADRAVSTQTKWSCSAAGFAGGRLRGACLPSSVGHRVQLSPSGLGSYTTRRDTIPE